MLGRFHFQERPDLGGFVAPRTTHRLAVHRWMVFGHSYAPQLVSRYARDWDLRPGAVLLDPFVGSGTTALAARALGFESIGMDLSPLAVLATLVKTSALDGSDLLLGASRVATNTTTRCEVPDPTQCEAAFTPRVLDEIRLVLGVAQGLAPSAPRLALAVRLALAAVAPQFSALVKSGGWLAAIEPKCSDGLRDAVAARLGLMAADCQSLLPTRRAARVAVIQGDARQVPLDDGSVDAVVSSPPYPNRHDYSRAYAVELAVSCASAAETRHLRRQQIESHPEAAPLRPDAAGYQVPLVVRDVSEAVLASDAHKSTKRFVPSILAGYALDSYLVCKELKRVLRRGGRGAIVVGCVSYAGALYPTDWVVADAAEQAGLVVDRIDVARRKATSAQQNRRFGTQHKRESVVVLTKPRSSRRVAESVVALRD